MKQETKLMMFDELALIAQINTFGSHLHIEGSLAFGYCHRIVVWEQLYELMIICSFQIPFSVKAIWLIGPCCPRSPDSRIYMLHKYCPPCFPKRHLAHSPPLLPKQEKG